MTFDKYMPLAGVRILDKQLQMPINDKVTRPPREFGILQIPIHKKKFIKNKDKFAFLSLYNIKLVVLTLNLIEKENHNISNLKIFKLEKNTY